MYKKSERRPQGAWFKKAVIKFLKENPGDPFTAREIATRIFEIYPNECREKQNRSKAIVLPLDSDKAVIGQLASEISPSRLGLQEGNT